MHILIHIVAFLCIAGFQLVCHASELNTVTPVSDQDEYNLSPYLTIWKDEAHTFSIEDLQSGAIPPVHRDDPAQVPNFGVSQAAYWAGFELESEDDLPREWLLETAFSGMDRVDLYYTDGNGGWVHKYAGQNYDFELRDSDFRNVVFTVPMGTGDSKSVFMRFENKGTMLIPLSLRTPESFSEYATLDTMLKGLFFGFMLAMILYNSLVAATVQMKSYIYYISFQVLAVLWIFIANGLALQYFWPHNPPQYSWDYNFSVMLMMLMPIAFFQSFVNVHDRAPLIYRLLTFAIVIQLTLTLMMPFIDNHLPWKILFIHISSDVIQLGLLGLGIWFVYLGDRNARFFVAAWASLITGIIATSLWRQGLGSYSTLLSNIDELAIIVEALILTLGLADNIVRIRHEKQAAEDSLTRERESALRSLREAEDLKDTFLETVSHELRTPLTGIVSLIDLVIDGSKNLDQVILGKLLLVRKSGQRLSKMVEDVLDLSAISQGQMSVPVRAIDTSPLIEHVIGRCQAEAADNGLAVENHIASNLPWVMADYDRLQQVLMNLVLNAIRSANSGMIAITGAVNHTNLEIHVSHTKPAAADTKHGEADNLSEQSRLVEDEVDFELSISKNLMELQGGSLSVSSESPNILRSTISLRLADEDQISEHEPPPSDEAEGTADLNDAFRQQLVTLLATALHAWEKSTGKSQVALAEASGIWRVTLDGSRQRARSMERYITLEGLPANPRWRSVTRTAHYVLTRIDMDETSRRELERCLDETLRLARNRSGH